VPAGSTPQAHLKPVRDREASEVPDLKNGATEKTEESEKRTKFSFSVLFVGFVAPFFEIR
jgi:hypothetical protein